MRPSGQKDVDPKSIFFGLFVYEMVGFLKIIIIKSKKLRTINTISTLDFFSRNK